MAADEQLADVVIVGGGASGAILAGHLLRNEPDGGPVVLIDRSTEPSLGVAYSTKEPSHLLNVPAAGMSAVHDQPNHFVDWLHSSKLPSGPDDFLPRATYGSYLRDVLDGAERRSDRDLLRLHGEAIDLELHENGATVELSGGARVAGRQVVLATGNASPRTPAFMEHVVSSRYISDPWDGASLSRIRADDRVMLIGTGLTAVDVVLTLASRGHSATIHAVSRHGLLPLAHREPLERAPSLRALPTLPSPLSALHLLRWVRAEIRAAEADGADWRDVINDLRPWTQTLWMELPQDQRRVFIEKLSRYWSISRHRMAPAVGETIERLRNTGQLLVLGAGMTVHSRADGYSVSLRNPDGTREARVNWIVNCTGPELDPERWADPLVQSLLADGAARRDPLGLGFDCEPEGRLVNSDGQPQPRLWAIGSLRVGSLWESTSVPEIREQAAELTLALDRENALVR